MVKQLRLVGITVMLLMACRIGAQSVSIPYSMSFELADSVEMQNWVLNNGPLASSCNDQWIVGTDQKSDGRRSLYISDNGVSAHMGMGPNIQFVYRDFVLPSGKYTVSFDWKNMGAANATLYAGCGPAANLPCVAMTSSSVLSSTYTTWCQPQTSQLFGQRYWQNARLLNVNSNGTRVMRLFFAWCSNNMDTTLLNPLGACIDNIQICSSNCPPPTSIDVVASCDTTIVTWTGTSMTYQVGYRRVGEVNWHTRSGLTTTLGTGTIILEGLQEGMYDFRVRGICVGDTSVYTYKSSVVIFCPDAHCINYINLHDTTGAVVCTYGHTGNIREQIGVVDYGPDDQYSRHTVNWDIDAYDIRTNNRLPLIPTGELASVRLGNWRTGDEAESITYDYYVDSIYSILLLKYAVVLEDPGHSKHEQPRFVLSVKDQNGQEVDATCGSADFYAGRSSGNKGDGWHYEPNLSWKEWTTYGIDLSPYVGQTLKIMVATYDCTQSGHYGYGYFTLGCAAARIEGVSCGDDAKMTAQAPEGFDYEWASIHDLNTVVSTSRLLEVDASDTTTYRCRLTYKDQPECHVDLFSSVFPRFPIADFSYKYSPTNCENRVVFKNLSHIMVKYEGDTTGTHHYNEPCDEYEWVVNGERFSDENPIIVFPQAGGRFPVTLFSSIADGKCTDDTTFFIDIPAIGDLNVNISDSICFGSTYTFGKQVIGTAGTYTEVYDSYAGCDSIVTLNLTILPQNTTTLPDTAICAKTDFILDGDKYPYTFSRQWIRRLQNMHGCDSTVVINVTLLDTVKPKVTVVQDIIEDGDLGTLAISGTGFSYYTLNGTVRTDSLLTDLGPDTYLFIFYNDHNCDSAVTVSLAPGCIGKIVYQRWNDVLSIKNPKYAGGRSFVKYQWIENGVPLAGETKSYYYAPNGLNFSSAYEVEVTDSLGNVSLTCPFHPEDLMPAPTLSPSRVESGGSVWLRTPEHAWVECYNMAGLKMFSADVLEGTTELQMPTASGIYVITAYTEDGKRSFRVCVTE
ncbi:MAG: hypothetical protein IKN59_00840 [Paludibacteraceae bacterium]|nr:hypothetical protein [Paludibacteraceae bacterium]